MTDAKIETMRDQIDHAIDRLHIARSVLPEGSIAFAAVKEAQDILCMKPGKAGNRDGERIEVVERTYTKPDGSIGKEIIEESIDPPYAEREKEPKVDRFTATMRQRSTIPEELRRAPGGVSETAMLKANIKELVDNGVGYEDRMDGMIETFKEQAEELRSINRRLDDLAEKWQQVRGSEAAANKAVKMAEKAQEKVNALDERIAGPEKRQDANWETHDVTHLDLEKRLSRTETRHDALAERMDKLERRVG